MIIDVFQEKGPFPYFSFLEVTKQVLKEREKLPEYKGMKVGDYIPLDGGVSSCYITKEELKLKFKFSFRKEK